MFVVNKRIKKILLGIVFLFFISGIFINIYLYLSGFDYKSFFVGGELSTNIKILIVLGIYFFRNYLLLPSTVIIIFTGFFLKDFYLSLIVSIVGVSIGIIQTYSIGYLLKETLASKKDFGLIKKYSNKIKQNGFKVIFGAAFFPIIPLDIVYYSAGFIKFNIFKAYLAGITGELSLIVLYVYFGEEASKHVDKIGYIVTFIFIIFILYFFLKKKIFLKNK